MSNAADLWARIQECERGQIRAESEKSNLKEKINELNYKVSDLNNTLRDKERCILELNRKLVSFDSVCLHFLFMQLNSKEDGLTEVEIQETLKEKVRTLEAYMIDIAHSVIKDSEQSSVEGGSKISPITPFK